MKWNYGVVRTVDDGVEMFSVHEIFHDEDGGKSWTAEPVTFVADTLAELEEVVRTALNDVKSAKTNRKRAFVDDVRDTE